VHPNVLPLRGVIDDDETGDFSLVMDLMEGGSLGQLLRKRGETLTFIERMDLSKQCGRAVQYLHTLPKPILHRDIKSPNFLIDRALER
jgi:serine/threonine protein kinase